MVEWLWMMNWKWCRRNQLWPILRYYYNICLEGLRKTADTSEYWDSRLSVEGRNWWMRNAHLVHKCYSQPLSVWCLFWVRALEKKKCIIPAILSVESLLMDRFNSKHVTMEEIQVVFDWGFVIYLLLNKNFVQCTCQGNVTCCCITYSAVDLIVWVAVDFVSVWCFGI